MIFDRLETLAAITFVEAAIPNKSETGKNCLFVRVEGDKLILAGGGEYVTKKAVLISQNTVEGAMQKGKKKLPEKFMIPRAVLSAFKEMMKEHKELCKKLAKSDPSHLFIEISDTQLISQDEKIDFQQPRHEFKELEPIFEVKQDCVYDIPIMSGDIGSVMTGFKKSDSVQVTFTGPEKPIYFAQGDFEAVMLPAKKKEESDDEQTEIDAE